MSDIPRDPPRGDARQNASIVVPVEQRSQVHPAPEDTIELSGGASSQRTTRQSDLAPGLAAWDTRTHEPAAANEAPPSAPPDFKPFFALVEDPVTGEYHHPEVHYVFSDDEDQGVLTHAALAAIDKDENTLQQSAGPEERIAVIDLDYDGRTVVGISSLSPEWQALRTEVWQAPGKADSRHGATDRGLMLRVSGKEAGDSAKAGKKESGDMDTLVERFSRGLGSLDEVLGEEGDKEQEEAVRQSRSQRPGSAVA